MKITSLTLQAFRGFNQQVTFRLEDADIIILYGPNGHGKSSVYDAIEWVLTGGIHRFDESTAERNRTRFIRNLHAASSVKAFVKLGIVLKNDQRFTIERQCTARANDNSDYGKHELTIWDESEQIFKEGEEAEATLQKWLIHSEWLSKISSPTTMLSLTHILSQEKIADFLKGMKERDRYDALSILFGTDQFDKYRESFRNTRSKLNSQTDGLKIKIDESKRQRDKLQHEVTQLETRIQQNEDTDFSDALEHYLKIYPNAKPYAENLEKLQKIILTNQQDVDVQRKKLQDDYYLLEEIAEVLPRLEGLHKTTRAALYEQQQLRQFKTAELSKMKIEQLLTEANNVNAQVATINQLTSLKNDSISKVDSLIEQRKKMTPVIETLGIQIATSNWREQQDFLLDVKEKIEIAEYEVIQSLFSNMVKANKVVATKELMHATQLVQLKSLETSLVQIKDTHQIYHEFLSSLGHYVSTTADINSCPACGTEGIRKKDIQNHLQQQQVQVDEHLPKLEKSKLQIQQTLEEIKKDIDEANKHISDSREKIEAILQQYKEKLKAIDVKATSEQQTQLNIQQKIDAIQLNLQQFKESCRTLGIELDNNIEQQLEKKHRDYVTTIKKINFEKKLSSESTHLPEPLKTMSFDISSIDEHERSLQQIIDSNEGEINRIVRLRKSLQTIEIDFEQSDVNELSSRVKREIASLTEKLTQFVKMEEANIKLRSLIEFSTEKVRLIQLQQQLDIEKKQLSELEVKQINVEKDLEILTELINKSTEAISNLNEQVFSNLKETIQAIFEQINSHPVFTKLDLVSGRRNNNNCLTINVTKTNGDENIKANAPYIFSSAQVNSIALSLFLAMSLKQKWSPLQLIGMDDPIQSMDEINLLSFIDLMRLFVEKHQKQIIISTHDHDFYTMMLKKFRYYDLAIIEYTAYGDCGPTINKIDEGGFNYSKFRPKLNYNQASQKLMHLDTNK